MPHYEKRIKSLLDEMQGPAWSVFLDGQELEKGYKPDRVYQYKRGTRWVIVEIEAHTSRKGFIGGALKAAKHFDEYGDENGIFIYIVSSRNFHNLNALKGQMTAALKWLSGYRIPIPPIYIVHDTTVEGLHSEGILFPSYKFFKRCIKVYA